MGSHSRVGSYFPAAASRKLYIPQDQSGSRHTHSYTHKKKKKHNPLGRLAKEPLELL